MNWKSFLLAALLIGSGGGQGRAQEDVRTYLNPGVRLEHFILDASVRNLPRVASKDRPGLPASEANAWLQLPAVQRVEQVIDSRQEERELAGAALVYSSWKGVLQVPRDGRYTFRIHSQGMARLWIDGFYGGHYTEPVIPSVELQAGGEARGSIELKSGYHEIWVERLGKPDPILCRTSWEGPGFSRQVIPPGVLFHKSSRGVESIPAYERAPASPSEGRSKAPGMIAGAESLFHLHTRKRVEEQARSGHFEVVEQAVQWDARRTAVIVCDMWDRFSCKTVQRWVDEKAPLANALVKEARRRGALIIHAPAQVINFYADTAQRRRAMEAVAARTEPIPIAANDPAREPMLPVDDWDLAGENGCSCDELPQCSMVQLETRQHPAIEIAAEDAISEDGREILNLLDNRNIENIVFLGLATNMCVMWRPFGIRELVRQGKNVVLVRDLTATLYNNRYWPFVDHQRGTEMVVEHIERYWCPSIWSSDLAPVEIRSGSERVE